ncbi:MAG: hypothetical protein KDA69_16955, partial [Planctomycetaceae bacterium]|nr:hypothetical protein [Planctomycetaceae bacterium]
MHDTLDLEQFLEDGFLVIDGLLDASEVDLLSRIARADCELQRIAYGRADADGQAVVLSVRNDLVDDYYSAIARSRRIVDP